MAVPEGSGEWVSALCAWPGDRLCSYLETHVKRHRSLPDYSWCEDPGELYTDGASPVPASAGAVWESTQGGGL